jgi:hypothetical protein
VYTWGVGSRTLPCAGMAPLVDSLQACRHSSSRPAWRLFQVRRQVLGRDAPPLLVVGPRPLRRALHAYAQLEPLTFVYLDNAHTLVRQRTCCHVHALRARSQGLRCWCTGCKC